MKFNNKMRYAIVMIACVLLNDIGYAIAVWLDAPVWLDVTGTALAALMLEPTAGLLVGLANNFYLALFAYTPSSLFYYSISAAVALIVGIYLRKNGKICKKRIFPAILLVIVASALLSSLLSLWRSGCVPDGAWETRFYTMFLSAGLPQYLACLLGIGVVKTCDTFVTAALVAVLYAATPKKLKFPVAES